MSEAYFNAQYLGEPTREFVMWLDCMGTQCFMNRYMYLLEALAMPQTQETEAIQPSAMIEA